MIFLAWIKQSKMAYTKEYYLRLDRKFEIADSIKRSTEKCLDSIFSGKIYLQYYEVDNKVALKDALQLCENVLQIVQGKINETFPERDYLSRLGMSLKIAKKQLDKATIDKKLWPEGVLRWVFIDIEKLKTTYSNFEEKFHYTVGGLPVRVANVIDELRNKYK